MDRGGRGAKNSKRVRALYPYFSCLWVPYFCTLSINYRMYWC